MVQIQFLVAQSISAHIKVVVIVRLVRVLLFSSALCVSTLA